MSALLARTRAAFGPAPRAITSWEHVAPPAWMKPDDALRGTYARIPELLKGGTIVWGHVVQANSLLFQAGDQACPADVLFAARGSDDLEPDVLERAAGAAFAIKGKAPTDPALARIASALAAEFERHPPLDLPAPLTRGVPMRLVSVMVHRPMLPIPRLVSSALPLLVNDARDAAMVLPKRHWADDLVRGWRALAAGPR